MSVDFPDGFLEYLSLSYHLPHYTALLNHQLDFAFTRWGDGEFNAVLGVEGENCDGHEYFDRLGSLLSGVLLDHRHKDDFLYGILPVALRVHGDEIDKYFAKNWRKPPAWCNGRALMDGSRTGNLRPFCTALNKRRVLLVGSYNLVKAWANDPAPLFRVDEFVDVPAKNAFLKMDDTIDKIFLVFKRARADVILYCAGMMSGVIMHMFHAWGKGQLTQIDCGSMFDPYYGNISRRYMSAYNWDELKRKNRANGGVYE